MGRLGEWGRRGCWLPLGEGRALCAPAPENPHPPPSDFRDPRGGHS